MINLSEDGMVVLVLLAVRSAAVDWSGLQWTGVDLQWTGVDWRFTLVRLSTGREGRRMKAEEAGGDDARPRDICLQETTILYVIVFITAM